MSTPRLLMGIDLGTSSLKVVIVDESGALVASGSAEYPILHPQQGHAEQNPSDWWHAATVAVNAAMQRGQVSSDAIAAIGLSGQMHGLVLLDGEQRLLGNAVIWPDQRSGDQVQSLTTALGAERLVQLGGSPVATGFMAATLRWFFDHQPDLLARATWALSPKDWLRLQMVGEVAADASDGSGALLIDVQARDWSNEIVAAVGVNPAILPPIAPSSSIAGWLTRSAASTLGLAVGIPVIVGAADAACALLGAGAADGRTLVVNLSTGGQLVLPVATPTVDPRGRLHTFCSALEPGEGRAGWYQMGATLNVGLALRWLRDNVLDVAGSEAYEQMMTLAADVPIGADGLLFLPYLVGERTPHMDPSARGAFLGMTASHERRHLVRSVVEGATMACADAYAVLLEVSPRPERVLLAGGGARSAMWRQMVADLFGVAVEQLLVNEQSATGAALLAGEGAGLFNAAEMAGRWARSGNHTEPNPSAQARYRELQHLSREAWTCNRTLMHDLGRFAAPH